MSSSLDSVLSAIGPKGRSLSQLFGMAHKHHTDTIEGDGVKQEFPLPVTVRRLDDLVVSIGGVRLRSSDRGIAYDYAVRGLTAGYAGDSNRVRFTVVPVPGAVITFAAVGG